MHAVFLAGKTLLSAGELLGRSAAPYGSVACSATCGPRPSIRCTAQQWHADVVCAETARTVGYRDLLDNRYRKFMPTIFGVNDCRKSVIDHRDPLSARDSERLIALLYQV